MKNKTLRAFFYAAAVSVALPIAATASDLVYQPINPSFGGSSLNSSHLLGTANAQRTATAGDADQGGSSRLGGSSASGSSSSSADLFIRQLEGRLLSSLAGQVTEAIFGDTPSESGTVTFGTTQVTFDRSIDNITLVITDSLEGTVTEIVVPQLVTSD